MSAMHFYLVCSMNKIGCSVFVCVLILVTTGAVDFNSKYTRSTATSQWTQPTTTTTKWNKPTSTTTTTTRKWKEPITTTTKWQGPTTTPRWKAAPWNAPSSTTSSERPISGFRYASPTYKKKESITFKTTFNNKDPITTKNYKPNTPISKWKQPSSTTDWKRTTDLGRFDLKASNNNGVFAVASFSNTDPRNGRLSSTDGIKVFSDSSKVNTDGNGNFYFKPVDGKLSEPITITKQGDGFSGTIRIRPGSVSVSSSASSSPNSGPVSAVASYNPWKSSYLKPNVDDTYFHPFPTFPMIPEPIFDTRFSNTPFQTKISNPFPVTNIREPYIPTRLQDPWFDKNMYQQPKPKYNTFANNWFSPSFNPYYHYW